MTLISCGASSPTTPAQIPTSVEYLNGQAAVMSTDLNIAAPLSKALLTKASPGFTTIADTAFAGATVTLYKFYADGTQEVVATTIADDNGNYQFTDVPISTVEDDASADFYYQIWAEKDGVKVTAPWAPTQSNAGDSGSLTVNLSPETKIATTIISSVATANSSDVLPTANAIEDLRDIVADAIYDYSGQLNIPSALTSVESTNLAYTSGAVASDHSNTEFITRMIEFERTALDSDLFASVDDVAAYLENLIRRGMDYADALALPTAAINAFAEAFIAGETFTPEEVVTAYNQNSQSAAIAASAASAFSDILSDLELAILQGADISQDDVLGLYARRGLTSATFDSSTEMEIDQVLLFVQSLGITTSNFNFIGFATDLLGVDISPTIAKASDGTSFYIADTNLYTRAYYTCPEATLAGRIHIYRGSSTVSSVTITVGSESIVLNAGLSGDAPYAIDLTDSEQVICLQYGTTYDIIIAIAGSGGVSDNATVTLIPVEVNEAVLRSPDRCDGRLSTALATLDTEDPTCLTAQLPVFIVYSPKSGTQDLPNGAPANSRIMYIFEYSTYSKSTGIPESGSPSACPTTAVSAPYDKDYFITTMACDIDACDAATGKPGDHVCRFQLNTMIVDAYGEKISYASTAFIYYCIEGQTGCE